MKRLLAALRFLTILPLGSGSSETDLAASVPFFPVVGLLLGAAGAALAWGLALVAPPAVAAVVVVLALAAFSGCLHLDGLSDTADGFFSSRDRKRTLEIMKDSHIGAMGMIAVVAVLLLKTAALASLPPHAWWPVVLLMPLAGRAALVVHMALLPYARTSGTGMIFYRKQHRPAAVYGLVVLGLVCWLAFDYAGLNLRLAAAIWIACLVVCLLLAVYAYRKIGGATGDTLGAVCELIETVPVLTAAIWLFNEH
jgi:adenosylcobinamide-GDP ribazoletransferase